MCHILLVLKPTEQYYRLFYFVHRNQIIMSMVNTAKNQKNPLWISHSRLILCSWFCNVSFVVLKLCTDWLSDWLTYLNDLIFKEEISAQCKQNLFYFLCRMCLLFMQLKHHCISHVVELGQTSMLGQDLCQKHFAYTCKVSVYMEWNSC